MTGREGPGPERPGPDYPPEWDDEPDEREYERLAVLGGYGLPAARAQAVEREEREHDLGAGDCEAPAARTVFPSLSRSCPVCNPPAEPEVTRERGECLSGNPQQWCRWNSECRSCAPVAGPRFADPSPDPWSSQGPVPPPPF